MALLCPLWLGGCSAVKVAYEQSPTLLYWWLDGQLDFSDTQTPQVRETLSQLQAWHRTQELPSYAELLGRMAALAEGPIGEAQACQLNQQVLQHMARLADEAARRATPMALTLDARQRQHLQMHWARKNAQWDEEWLQGPLEQRLKRRVDKAVERYADFYGTLSPLQTAMVRRHIVQSVWTPEWGQQQMRRRQQLLLEALNVIAQNPQDARLAETRLRGVWEQVMNPPGSADRERQQAWIAQGCAHIAELHNSASPEQRQRAARRLRAYEKDLRELAGRS